MIFPNRFESRPSRDVKPWGQIIDLRAVETICVQETCQ